MWFGYGVMGIIYSSINKFLTRRHGPIDKEQQWGGGGSDYNIRIIIINLKHSCGPFKQITQIWVNIGQKIIIVYYKENVFKNSIGKTSSQ